MKKEKGRRNVKIKKIRLNELQKREKRKKNGNHLTRVLQCKTFSQSN